MITSLVSGAHLMSGMTINAQPLASSLFVTDFDIARAIGLTGCLHSPPSHGRPCCQGQTHDSASAGRQITTVGLVCQRFRHRRPSKQSGRHSFPLCPFPKEGHIEQTRTVQASFQLFGPTFVLISKDRRYGQSCVSNVTASEAAPGQSPFSLCCSDTTEAVPRFHHCCSTGEAMLSLLSCHITAEATPSTPHRGWERHGRSRVPLVPVGRARAMPLFQSLGTLAWPVGAMASLSSP